MANVESLRRALRAQPFRMFSLKLVDGTEYAVSHPDWLSIPPETRSHALRGNAVFDAPRRPVPAEGRRAAREAFPRREWERVTRFPGYWND